MRLNHADVVLTYEGIPMLNDPDPEKAEPVTFHDLAMVALSYTEPDTGAERKSKIFGLSLKFYKGKFVKLTVDEAALLKDQGGKALSAIAFGRLCEWLEGQTPVVASDEDDDIEDAVES